MLATSDPRRPRAANAARRQLCLVSALAVSAACDPAPGTDSRGSETGETGWENEVCPFACEVGDDDPFADCVHVFDPSDDTVAEGAYNHEALPGVVTGAPGGSLDTVSLGCGGEIVVGFGGDGVVDGPGVDLIVFENPFDVSFPEPGRVEVSVDGCTWQAFDCDPITLAGCAGASLVHATPDSGVDPRDPSAAGGDAFDIAQLGLSQVKFVRIVDVSAAYWQAQGDGQSDYCDPGQGGKGGFDLDAMVAVHAP